MGKRLLILLAILLLAVGLGFAGEPPDMSGTLIFAMTTDFENAKVNEWFSEAFFNLKENVTPNTAINIQVQGQFKPSGQDVTTPTGTANLKALTANIDDFYISSNLGAILKYNPDILALTYNVGWYPAGVTTYTISNYGYENVAALDPGSMGAIAAKVTLMKNFGLLAWFNPRGPGAASDTNPFRYGANLTGTLGPVSASGWYYSNAGHAFDEGKVGGSVGLNLAFGELTVGGDFEIVTPLNVHQAASYGAAVRVGFTPLIGLIGELAGNSDSVQKVALEVESTILPQLGICSGIAFDTTGDKAKFDNAELGAWVKIDAVKIRFGYMVTDTAAALGSMYVSQVPQNGGAFIKCYLNF